MSLLRTVSLVALSALAACTTYYKIDDPGSGKSFYTTDIKREREGGAITFKDAQTGAETTMQNSQVLEIDKKQYQEALGKK